MTRAAFITGAVLGAAYLLATGLVTMIGQYLQAAGL